MNQASLAFTGAGSAYAQNLDISQAKYKGTFTESDTCGGVATVSATSNANGHAVYDVTPLALGACQVTVTGGGKKSVSVPVTVKFNLLFVANASNVTVYPSYDYTTASPMVISSHLSGPLGNPALDSSGDLFISNGGNDTVTEYPAGNYTTASPTVISADINQPPGGIQFDSSQDMFVGSFRGSWVIEYPHGNYTTGSPTVITTAVNYPQPIWVDSANNLWVGNCPLYTCRVGSTNGYMSEYPAGAYTTASPTIITAGVQGPNSIWTDSSGNVFLANGCPGYYATSCTVTLVEYPAGNYTTPTPTIMWSGTGDLSSVVGDSAGDIFVTNCMCGTAGGTTNTGYVMWFAPGHYTSPPTIISADLTLPWSLWVDPAGNLFVANWGTFPSGGSGHADDRVLEYPVGNYTTASPTVITTDIYGPQYMEVYAPK